MLVYLGKSDCIRTKVVVFGQKKFKSGKSGCLPVIWLPSGKVVVFKKGACIWAKVVVFRQKWMYSGRLVVFGEKWLFEQSCCI